MAGETDTRLLDAFQKQAVVCASLGSEFMGQLCNLLARQLQPGTPVSDHLFALPGDLSSSGDSVPLRLAGALHRLVLTGRDVGLGQVYPPQKVDDDTLWAAVSRALIDHSDTILQCLKSPPQTNEVRRSAALIGVGQFLAHRYGLPMMVSELGASAGLNLNWHRFRLDLPGGSYGAKDASVVLAPEWKGQHPPPGDISVLDRRGVDLRPVDISDPYDRVRLKSYLWPDQPHRMALTENAMALDPAPVDQDDAIDWLAQRLPQQTDNSLHLIYHTIAWQYFPADKQVAGRKLIEDAGENATETKPLAWFSMEADMDGPGAGLYLRLWPGDHKIALGRADFHGRWIDWQAGGAASDLI